jgi:Tfp pilus assembly protein PilN
MRAVNLIPSERRHGGGAGGGGRSGGAVYLVLGTLAALVIMLALSAVEGKGVKDKEAQAAVVNINADAAEAQANSLASYANFAALKNARIDTVASLAKSRFDWSDTMRDVAGTIPSNVWITKLVGTVSPAVSIEGAGGGTAELRAKISAPAIEILGCTTTQQSVARMMSQMRALQGVQRVSLSSSEKADTAGGGGAAGDSAGGSDDCRNGSDSYPQFSLVIFFEPIEQAQAPTASAVPTVAPSGAGQ